MKATTNAFIVFLIVVLSGYATPEPALSPLPIPTQGIAGIGNTTQVDEIGADAWYSWCLAHPWQDARFIPQMRDANDWQALYSGEVVITPTLMLGFNEPDSASQANLTPQEALPLERWRLMHYPRTLHASPAPSQNNIYWLQSLRNLYVQEYGAPPNWSYLSAHCYFYSDWTLSLCKSKINQYITWSNAWDANGVLVTEFSSFAMVDPPDTAFDWDSAVSRAQNFINWMEAQPEIIGWFWFSTNDWGCWPWYMTTALYDDGELTPLGKMYQDVNEGHD